MESRVDCGRRGETRTAALKKSARFHALPESEIFTSEYSVGEKGMSVCELVCSHQLNPPIDSQSAIHRSFKQYSCNQGQSFLFNTVLSNSLTLQAVIPYYRYWFSDWREEIGYSRAHEYFKGWVWPLSLDDVVSSLLLLWNSFQYVKVLFWMYYIQSKKYFHLYLWQSYTGQYGR